MVSQTSALSNNASQQRLPAAATARELRKHDPSDHW